jgi:hypothetical protein
VTTTFPVCHNRQTGHAESKSMEPKTETRPEEVESVLIADADGTAHPRFVVADADGKLYPLFLTLDELKQLWGRMEAGTKRRIRNVDVVKEAARIGRQEEAPSAGEIGVRAAVFLNPRLSDNARWASLAKVVGAILHDLNNSGRFNFKGRVGRVLETEQVYDTSAAPLLLKEVLAAVLEALSEFPDGQVTSHHAPKNRAKQEDAELSVTLLDHLRRKVEESLWNHRARVIDVHNEYERGRQKGQKDKAYSVQTDPETVDVADTINPYAEFEVTHSAQQFLESLPEKEQAQFALVIAGLTPEQIAVEMDVTRSTVDNRSRKIRQKQDRFFAA